MKEAIKTEKLTLSYGKKPVLFDIDLSIPQNTICAIIGPNGAGKSTLLKGILNIIKPVSGKVSFWDKNLDDVRDKISYVPQTSQVNWDFPISVFDVVLMGRYQHIGLFKGATAEDKEKVMEALRIMQMDKYKDKQISKLSGGQKQRVFIARSLCQDADLYIMDEPLAGVDLTTEKIIMETFKKLQDQGKTIIAVHHDLNTIEEYFDYLVILNETVKAQGFVKDEFRMDNITKAYRIGG